MKYLKVVLLSLLWIGTTLASCAACEGIKDPTVRKANSTILDNTFTINDIKIPVSNFYKRLPGCYLACYSKTTNQVQGLLRINGLYIGPTCMAQGFFFKDIAKLSEFEKLCDSQITQCDNNCVPSGETGAWLGVNVTTLQALQTQG